MKPVPQNQALWKQELELAFGNAQAMANQANKAVISFAPMLVAINRDAKAQLPDISQYIATNNQQHLPEVPGSDMVEFYLAYLDGNIFLQSISEDQAKSIIAETIAAL